MSRVLVTSSLARSRFILKNILNGNFYCRNVWQAGVNPDVGNGLRYFNDHPAVDAEVPNRKKWSWRYEMQEPQVMEDLEEMIQSGAMARDRPNPGSGGSGGASSGGSGSGGPKPPQGGGSGGPKPPQDGGSGGPKPPQGGGSGGPKPPQGGGSGGPKPPQDGGSGGPKPPQGGGSGGPKPPQDGGSGASSPSKDKCEFTIDREIKFCIPVKMKGEIDTSKNGECKPDKSY